MCRIFIGLFLFYLSQLQVLATSTLSLKEINVLANGEDEFFSLMKPETLTDEDLKFSPTQKVVESLKYASGVIVTENGGPGSRASFYIRGTEARHVLFTIDGLKINDPSTIDRQFDAAYISSSALQGMRILKGPQTILYGSDALGGVVELKTRKGHSSQETRGHLNMGSFGTIGNTLSTDWASKSSKGTLTATYFRTQGLSHLNKNRYDASERDGAKSLNLTSSSTHQWSLPLSTDLLFSFVRGESELDGYADDNSHDMSKSDHYMIQQKTELKFNKKMALSLRNGLSRHQRSIFLTSPQEEKHFKYEGDLIQHELLYSYQVRSAKLLIGLGLEEERFYQIYPRQESQLQSFFSKLNLETDLLFTQMGVRHDIHSRFGDFTTGSIGTGLKSDWQALSLIFSQGHKAPTLYQLHGPAVPGFIGGNKNLQPEKNHSLELIWRGNWQTDWANNQLEITWFRNKLSDLIIYSSQTYHNESLLQIEGLEVDLDLKWPKLRVRPSFTLQEYKYEESPVLGRPTRMLGLDIFWFKNDAWEWFTKVRSFNDRKSLNNYGHVVELEGYEIVTLGTRYHWPRHEIGLQIINLTNKIYEDIYGQSVMPRSLFIDYMQRF